jgi:hypothetical protein
VVACGRALADLAGLVAVEQLPSKSEKYSIIAVRPARFAWLKGIHINCQHLQPSSPGPNKGSNNKRSRV